MTPISARAVLLAFLAAAPAAGLTNPVFLVSDPAAPAFGWETRGAVSVSNGAALLQEDDRLLTRLAQTFVIPEGAQTLRFTLSANLTARNPLQPPDAFEVALLDATTLSPLTGTASGLADTDALLNLQPNGELFVAPGVTVPETNSFPMTVEVDLRSVPAGTRATLSFDLLGFRPAGSSVTVDNVFISREGAVSSVVKAGGPYSAVIGEPVSFDGSGSSDADGSIVLYEWDFESDGIFDSSSGEPTASHTYFEAGTFTATLRVTDDTGLISIDTASVEVRSPNRPPVADLQGPSTAEEGETLTFNAGGSSDPDGDTLIFEWSFGDGGSGSGSNVTHTYADDGNYQVSLTVTDPSGLSDTKSSPVTIVNVAPEVDAGPDLTAKEEEELSGTGSFADPGADTWTATVDYGDGSGVQPLSLRPDGTFELRHTYTKSGSFTLTVQVRDDDGGVGTGTAAVTILPRTRPPVCPAARPSAASLWPPNHKFVSIKVLGVTDPDGDPVRIRIDRIRQDEPLNGTGDGDTSPDGSGIGTDTVRVRAERAGTGNGRVYHIFFTAEDGRGGSCTGEVLVGVPHDQGQGRVAVDDGPLFDSTLR